MEKTAALILAAGLGKRMKSKQPKALQTVLFKPMIDWVLDAVRGAGVPRVCVVAGHGHEQVEKHLGGSCDIALQTELLGTGHAVMQAAGFLQSAQPDDVIVLYADAPFITAEAIRESFAAHKKGGNALTVVTAQAQDPFGYGRILRGDGQVTGIVEEKDATPAEREIREINSGIYWFSREALLFALSKLQNNNAQGEYYLTDAVGILVGAEKACGAFMLPDMQAVAGANDRRQLAQLNAMAKRMVLDRLYEDGVSLLDEAGVLVGPDVRVGADTLLLPGTILRGHTVIGENCVIGPDSLVEDCEIGDGVKFNASQAYQSKIEAGVTVGPYCHIRPHTHLHAGVHVGDFVEIKNSEIGEGTKVPHLTYVGDSDVGKKVNFGCGCVTVNYDGVNKHRTKVGDNAFIGCNTNLVAPVTVGDNAYTAAGSTITKPVPDNALAVARTRQENLEGWVLRKRKKK